MELHLQFPRDIIACAGTTVPYEVNTVCNCTVRSLLSVLNTEYGSSDKIKKNEMGRTCSACFGKEMCIQGFSRERCEKEANWKIESYMAE